MNEPIISCRQMKYPVFGVVGLIVFAVTFVCTIDLMAYHTNRSVVPLQATLDANPSINLIAPNQRVSSDTIQEQELIALLMQDPPLSEKSAPKPGWRRVQMRVTGYCPCSQCCGSFSDGITANNHHIQPGDRFVAADKSYPFGTDMVIPGYNSGNAVQVLDRGGAIQGNRLDLFFHTHQHALEWGVQHLDVLVKIK